MSEDLRVILNTCGMMLALMLTIAAMAAVLIWLIKWAEK